jgi:lipopolysaccharide/colanic/teichoic acid biosynthesis glycosyltransferase
MGAPSKCTNRRRRSHAAAPDSIARTDPGSGRSTLLTPHGGGSEQQATIPATCAAHRGLAPLLKRSLDVVGSTAALTLLLPVFVGCALAVKANSSGPVLFRQIRVGRDGQTFRCFKFRTMQPGSQERQEQLRSASIQDGPAFKLPDDPRITRVGRVLRRYSLDELPQFLNVLIGDMSMVGPRPPLPAEVEKYSPWQRRRISVKPGLTCIWQVHGRNRVSFDRWVAMDLHYIDHWSLWLDIKLILLTVRVVLADARGRPSGFRGIGAKA